MGEGGGRWGWRGWWLRGRCGDGDGDGDGGCFEDGNFSEVVEGGHSQVLILPLGWRGWECGEAIKGTGEEAGGNAGEGVDGVN